jgi:hypothetical protein
MVFERFRDGGAPAAEAASALGTVPGGNGRFRDCQTITWPNSHVIAEQILAEFLVPYQGIFVETGIAG